MAPEVMTPARPASGLVGRAGELSRLQDFLSAAPRGAGLLLLGEPGVGKSALLDAAADRARAAGFRQLFAAGRRLETGIEYGALDRLLVPCRQHLTRLAIEHRRPLSAALGMSGAQAPGPDAVGEAALTLLHVHAGGRPLLVVVDDVQWLDPPSAAVLAYVAGHTDGSGVHVLLAGRGPDRSTSLLPSAALPSLHLHPLSTTDARSLLTERAGDLSAGVAERILEDSRGLPLALLELAAQLSPPERAGSRPLAPVLRVTERLGSLFSDRIAVLPGDTRRVLLLAALHGDGDLQVVEAAAGDPGAVAALAVAERARLAVVGPAGRTITFSHPVLRSTLVAMAAPLERRRAHRALAAAQHGDPIRRAWHLAEATVGTDQSTAALVEQASLMSLERGDASGALSAMTRAAELCPSDADRTRCLLQAAYLDAVVTGDLQHARDLLAAVPATVDDRTSWLRMALAAAYLLLNGEGDVGGARSLLMSAVRDHPQRTDATDPVLVDALQSLVLISWLGGAPASWEPVLDVIARLRPAVPRVLHAQVCTLGDPVRLAGSVVEDVEDLDAGLTTETNPIAITRVAIANLYTDRMGDCREALARVVADDRGGRAVAVDALFATGVDDWSTGRWDELVDRADEGAEWGESHGQHGCTYVLGGSLRALVAAARGERTSALRTAEELVDRAQRHAFGMALHLAQHVRALAAAGSGDWVAAFEHATAISPPGTLAPYTPHALWVALDVVESGVRCGRRTEATAHALALRDAQLSRWSSRLALVTHGCLGMVGGGDDAAGEFQQALDVPDAGRWPFEHARVQLAYGDLLRGQGRRPQAREQYTRALLTFDRLGAAPWAALVAAGLRSTGKATFRADQGRIDAITAQQWDIARLAASGLTNKEIGQRLFMSHRTVGASLYRLFPLLGITSRAALRDRLRDLPQGTPPQTGVGGHRSGRG